MRHAITPRRLAANRANAAKSTGPRTAAGKQRSSQNSLHHASFAAHLLQPGEDESDLHTLRNALLADLAPQNTLELCLADRVVSAAWRLRRLQHADHCLALMEDADVRAEAADYNRRLDERAELPADEPAAAADAPDTSATATDSAPEHIEFLRTLAPGLLIARALRAPTSDLAARQRTSPFERLLSAELRLTGMMARAIRDLRQLRLDRRDPTRAPDDHTPFATPDPLDEDNPPSTPACVVAPPPDPPPTSSSSSSSSSSSLKSQLSDLKSSPSVSSVSSVAEHSSSLQNEPICQSGSSPADLLARAASLSAQMLPHRRKERPNP